MVRPDDTPTVPADVRPRQLWRDREGHARVLAVAEGYAMMRRHRRNPFLVSTDVLLTGARGWHYEGLQL